MVLMHASEEQGLQLAAQGSCKVLWQAKQPAGQASAGLPLLPLTPAVLNRACRLRPLCQTVRLYDGAQGSSRGILEQQAPVLDVCLQDDATAFCACLDGQVKRCAPRVTRHSSHLTCQTFLLCIQAQRMCTRSALALCMMLMCLTMRAICFKVHCAMQ